jgi:hypothetical protein
MDRLLAGYLASEALDGSVHCLVVEACRSDSADFDSYPQLAGKTFSTKSLARLLVKSRNLFGGRSLDLLRALQLPEPLGAQRLDQLALAASCAADQQHRIASLGDVE